MFQRGFVATTSVKRLTADVTPPLRESSRPSVRGHHRVGSPAWLWSKDPLRRETGMEVRLLAPVDAARFDRVASGVFDNTTDRELTRAFLADPRHHIAVAIDDGIIVGFASAVHYIHPDKPAELWINEVGVAPSHHRRGIGKQVVGKILEA